MKSQDMRLVITLGCAIGVVSAGLAHGQSAGKSPESVQPDAADATKLLKTAIEQNENLRRVLEETRGELNALREEVSLLRAGLSDLQTTRTADKDKPGAGLPATRQPDLAERVMVLEDQVDIHSSQIREQAQTKVESESRFKMRMFGTLLFNSYFNTQDTAEAAVPVVAPASTVRIPNGGDNFGATLRQTSLGLALTGPKLGAARLSADVDFDFYGGAPGEYGTDVLGALRMRTAVARLDGNRTSVALGLMAPMISPLNPTSLAATYYPALGDSGNLWQWLPQTTVAYRWPVSESGALGVQGGLIMPSGENFYGRNLEGRPGYESRVLFAREQDPDRRLEVGVGAYIHPRDFGFGRTVHSYAVTADWLIPLMKRLELSGEAYYGQSITLRSSSGGDVSSLFAFTGGIDDPLSVFRGIRSAGGWMQLRARANAKLEFNAAYGSDDPRDRDIFAGIQRRAVWRRNRTFSLNTIYELRSNFLLGLEYRRLSTLYPDLSSTNDHVNLAVAYLF